MHKDQQKNKKYLLEEIQAALLAQGARIVLQAEIDIPFVQELFNQLLTYHIYTDDMLDVLYPPCEAHVESEVFYPYLRKALQSVHVMIPDTEQQAREIMIQYCLERIAEKNADPENEIADMMRIITDKAPFFDISLLGPAEALYRAYEKVMATHIENDSYISYTYEPDEATLAYWAKQKADLVKIAKACLKKWRAKENKH